jgi:hypothetical protein
MDRTRDSQQDQVIGAAQNLGRQSQRRSMAGCEEHTPSSRANSGCNSSAKYLTGCPAGVRPRPANARGKRLEHNAFDMASGMLHTNLHVSAVGKLVRIQHGPAAVSGNETPQMATARPSTARVVGRRGAVGCPRVRTPTRNGDSWERLRGRGDRKITGMRHRTLARSSTRSHRNHPSAARRRQRGPMAPRQSGSS